MTEPLMAKKRRVSLCVGCGSQIHDQFILRVSPDLEWHAACLKCVDCHQYLDETCTCFVRDGKTYCKRDYTRLFGAKCAKCNLSFTKTDFVMRARNKIYHIDCFRCIACARQLIPGDEFALRDDGLFCKADHDTMEKTSPVNGKKLSRTNGTLTCNESSLDAFNGASNGTDIQMAANAESVQSNRNRDSIRPQVHKQNHSNSEHKPTRVRTVLNEKQLHTLRTCYNANPRPDALMKEQLVEMTGLSPRVIRVWFQNKRCKDKKRNMMIKQIQNHDKDGRHLSLGSLRGVPMVATSPVRHESPIQANPIEVQTYQPPWKALTEYAMQGELDPNTPHFQQLVSQASPCDARLFGRIGARSAGGSPAALPWSPGGPDPPTPEQLVFAHPGDAFGAVQPQQRVTTPSPVHWTMADNAASWHQPQLHQVGQGCYHEPDTQPLNYITAAS